MKKLAVIYLVLAGLVLNSLFPNFLPSRFGEVHFGAASYPTTIDTTTTLPNPGATDSVAAVSHSGLHTNENGAIEALETKVGIESSTPSANTVLFGDGTGSIWSASPTLTGLTLSNTATSSHLLSTGSSTLQAFTFTTATGTAATTTNFFSTVASTTNLFGAGLQTCNGSQFLQWSSGAFGCAAVAGNSTFAATTTLQNLATTTINLTTLGFSNTRRINIVFETGTPVGSGATSSASVLMALGNDLSANYTYSFTKGAASTNSNNQQTITIGPTVDQRVTHHYFNIDIDNPSAPLVRMGNWTAYQSATSSSAFTPGALIGDFIYNNTTPITRVDIWWSQPNVLFSTSTTIYISSQ